MCGRCLRLYLFQFLYRLKTTTRWIADELSVKLFRGDPVIFLTHTEQIQTFSDSTKLMTATNLALLLMWQSIRL